MNPSSAVARILLCEDSPTYAEALSRFLEHDRDLRVVARCRTGEQALERLRRSPPDLVVMDLELPGAGGVETIRRMLELRRVPILVLSAYAQRGSEVATAALAAGAVDARPKSDLSLREPLAAPSVAFRRYVKRLAYARVGGRRRPLPPPGDAVARARGRAASVIGISASTGGPVALLAVLEPLPADFPVPILVVQHIAAGFLDGLVSWLDAAVAVQVRRARDRSSVGPGVWFAPDDAHLMLDARLRTHFDSATVSGYHRPAGDVLLTSIAAAVGPRGTAVVLTGMGSDGAQGTAAVRAAGGLTIAQDEGSSVVYGMPRAAAEEGAELVLPLGQIGPVLAGLRRAEAVA